MVTQLQPDVRAYLHGGEVIKRYISWMEIWKKDSACCVRIINHRGREVCPYPQNSFCTRSVVPRTAPGNHLF